MISRSITLRLIFAFLLVGIIVVALASGITYWLTVRDFKQLTFDQARNRFVADMTFYYQTNGTWDGVLDYYRLRSSANSHFNPPPNSQPPGIPGGGQATAPDFFLCFSRSKWSRAHSSRELSRSVMWSLSPYLQKGRRSV